MKIPRSIKSDTHRVMPTCLNKVEKIHLSATFEAILSTSKRFLNHSKRAPPLPKKTNPLVDEWMRLCPQSSFTGAWTLFFLPIQKLHHFL